MLNDTDFEHLIERFHYDCFDTPYYKEQLFQLYPAIDEVKVFNHLPKVFCWVSSDESWLDITFLIQDIPEKIDIPSFDIDKAIHTDFLWEDNCLELFIADNTSNYYEINASLDGKFAVYQFDNYRNPSTLPPTKSSDITFQWRNTDLTTNLVYQFSLLISKNANFAVDDITTINPCAILYQHSDGKKLPIYYAVNHANPPDFHDKRHWLSF